eukprot:gene19402-biopygen20527
MVYGQLCEVTGKCSLAADAVVEVGRFRRFSGHFAKQFEGSRELRGVEGVVGRSGRRSRHNQMRTRVPEGVVGNIGPGHVARTFSRFCELQSLCAVGWDESGGHAIFGTHHRIFKTALCLACAAHREGK